MSGGQRELVAGSTGLSIVPQDGNENDALMRRQRDGVGVWPMNRIGDWLPQSQGTISGPLQR
jgi:hypothetical protein